MNADLEFNKILNQCLNLSDSVLRTQSFSYCVIVILMSTVCVVFFCKMKEFCEASVCVNGLAAVPQLCLMGTGGRITLISFCVFKGKEDLYTMSGLSPKLTVQHGPQNSAPDSLSFPHRVRHSWLEHTQHNLVLHVVTTESMLPFSNLALRGL